MSHEDLLAKLDGVRVAGSGHVARCPAHDDRHQSLGVGVGGDGKLLLRCHAGCSFDAIVSALGVEPGCLFPDVRQPSPKKTASSTPPLSATTVATWTEALWQDPVASKHVTETLRISREVADNLFMGLFVDSRGKRWLAYPYQIHGTWCYANCRSLDGPKGFLRIPSGQTTILYRQDQLQNRGTAILVEGERDAAALLTMSVAADLGGAEGATVVAMPGASQINATIEALRNQAMVYVATDADNAGDKAAEAVISKLGPERCRRVRLPRHKDVGDLLSELGPEEAAKEFLLTAQAKADPLTPSVREWSNRSNLCERLPSIYSRIEEGLIITPSALERLNTALGGGYPFPGLIGIVAPPKCGKSTRAVADALAHLDAHPDNRVWLIDLENGLTRFGRRLLCQRSEVNPGSLTRMTKEQLASWNSAKKWLESEIGSRFYYDQTPPTELEFESRIGGLVADTPKTGKLMVIIDSMNRLPGNLIDRRAMVDAWVGLFERLRLQYPCTIQLILETARDGKESGGYRRGMTAAKESGRIEYAVDLLLSVDRLNEDGSPVQLDEEPPDGEGVFSVRVEVSRDSTFVGPCATYRLVSPHYGFLETGLVRRTNGHSAQHKQKICQVEKTIRKHLDIESTVPAQIDFWVQVTGIRDKTIYGTFSDLVERGILIRSGSYHQPTFERGPNYDKQ